VGEVIEFREALNRIADRVSVDDRLTEIVSHSPVLRSGTKSLHLDTDHLDPDEQLVPLKEMTVSLSTPTRETGNRRRLLMAAAAVVAVIGLAGIAILYANDDQSPSLTAVGDVAPSTTVPAATAVAPRTETVHLAATGAKIPVTLTAPVDWIIDGNTVHSGIGGVGLDFSEIANIYADGCQWMTADPPVGPTVDDLASAWDNVADVVPTAMQDVVVDGYHGKQIEFTVKDFRPGDCKSDLFALWYSPGDNAPGFWLQGRNANQHTQQRILDVDGTRLVISAYYLPSSLAEDRAALEDALASVQIG
jgi:hypothetical protein